MAADHVWNRIVQPDLWSCWEWQGASHGRWGHGCAKINGRTVLVHRWVYEQLVGSIPAGIVVRHTCDNPRCCNPAHLLLGTHADNVQDRVTRGRSAVGERNGRHKLNSGQVLAIYQRAGQGETKAALAREYGVDATVIGDIVTGKKWKSVTGR